MSPSRPPVFPAVELAARLRAVQNHPATPADGSAIKIPDIGYAISNAYEQLRNAAEYTEEHLLLQRASRRFYKRNISLYTKHALGNIGEEAVIELTQAGYLTNGTVSITTAATIQALVNQYVGVYWQLRDTPVSVEEASEWIFDIMSVETENLLNPHGEITVFAYFAYQHYTALFADQPLLQREQQDPQYAISLYVAVHRALLKSDIATVRHDLLRMYNQTPDDIVAFAQFNHTITELYNSALTRTLQRTVSRYGAPLRILKEIIEKRSDAAELLASREQFLAAYREQTFAEYRAVGKRLRKGLIKSIVFLLITKALIGIGVEVPYDLFTAGAVALLPLGINLLFPPLYMASLKLSISLPSDNNARALSEYIDKALFTAEPAFRLSTRLRRQPLSAIAKTLYSALFAVPFAIIVFVLSLLHFSVVQGVIFFVFLSTASFLGFRLSQIVRELELVVKEAGLLRALQDFFYLPFILVGQWMSSKYARTNIVGMVLDMLIELPLKTILRLIRQWVRFLNEKREQIY